MLKYEEKLLVDMKNLLYHRSDDVERLVKQLEDADIQPVDCMKQTKSMDKEKELRQKELEELRASAQVIMDMVDPQEEGVTDNRTLLDHLHEALQKVASYVSETTRTYVAHALGLVKSFWPKACTEALADGLAADCFEEKFVEYLQEVKPVANKIVENLEQD